VGHDPGVPGDMLLLVMSFGGKLYTNRRVGHGEEGISSPGS